MRMQNIEEKINKDKQRLDNIFQICLEPQNLGDYLSLKSPKDFVVHYFTISRNHPVKSCRGSQCQFSPDGLRIEKNIRQEHGANLEFKRCKQSQIARQDQFAHCANTPNEIQNSLTDKIPWKHLPNGRPGDDSHCDYNLTCSNSKQNCNSSFSCDSCCTTKTFTVSKSSRVSKKHAMQQTEPEQSWQSKCSNFIINLPVTLSDKLFGPRVTACEILKDDKCIICDDDSKINRHQPISMNTSSKPNSKNHSSKKLVKSRVDSLGNHGCDKNIETDRVFVEKLKQVDPCYSTRSQSAQKDVSCGRHVRRCEKSTETCKKITSTWSKYCEKSDCVGFEISGNRSSGRINSRVLKPNNQGLSNWRNKRILSSSLSEEEKRGKISPRFSNWPAILAEKFFRQPNEKVTRPCCLVDNEWRKKNKDMVEDCPEIVSHVDSSFATKKGRLLLKKYTISQTPKTTEEILCFDIVDDKRLTERKKSKLHSHVFVKVMASDKNRKKLETIRERNEMLRKCSTAGLDETETSKRSMKSKEKVRKTCSKKTQRLEKTTSTEHIFFSNLIMKLIKKQQRNDKNHSCKEKKLHRNKTSEKNGNKTNIISRKYATTSIHKHKNRLKKSSKTGENNVRKIEAISCSLKQNKSPVCCNINFEKTSENNDFSSYHSDDSMKNLKDLSKKIIEIKLKKESTDDEEIHNCNICGSPKVISLVESGVLADVIDRNDQRESNDICNRASNRKKFELKSDPHETCCKKILNKKKLTGKIRRRNKIDYNNLHSVYRGRYCGELIPRQRKTVKEKISTENNVDFIESKNEVKNSNGNDICIKVFHDCQTCTDDLSELKYNCQDSKCPGEKIRSSKEFLCDEPTVGDDIESKKNISSLIERNEQNDIPNAIQSSKVQDLIRDPQSGYPVEDPLLKENSNSNRLKQPENVKRIMVGCKESMGSSCEDDTCLVVRPAEISKAENILETLEQDVQKVFSTMWEEACRERGNTTVASVSNKGLIKSEPKEALEIFKEDDTLSERQNNSVKSSSLVGINDFSTQSALVREKGSSLEKGNNENKNPEDDVNLFKANPNESMKQQDEIHRRIDSIGNRSNWIKSRRTDLTVTIPDSRNKINSHFSQQRSVVASRREVRNNGHAKAKREKAERDGSVSGEKSSEKPRKHFQRIENVRQVVKCTANVIMRDDKTKKQNGIDKEDIVNQIQNQIVFYNDSNAHFVPNISINDNVLHSALNTDEINVVNSEIQTLKASKIPKKSRPLMRHKTSERPSALTIKAPGNSTAKLKESLRKSLLREGNSSGTNGSSKTDAKGTVKEAEKIAASGVSESSNKVTKPIDTCYGRGREGQKELRTPAYIFDIENAKGQNLSVEMPDVIEQNNGTKRIEKRDASSSKISKLSSFQKDGEKRRNYKIPSSLNSTNKSKQETNSDHQRPESSQYKSRKYRNACESNNAGESSKNQENIKKQEIHCSPKRKDKENRPEEVITKIVESEVPKVKCEESTKSECKAIADFKRLERVVENSKNEKEKEIMQRDNAKDKLTTFCTSGKVISDSMGRNSSFTDDLKRFLDHGQEFFTSKKKKNKKKEDENNNQTALCNVENSNEMKRCSEMNEYCKNTDYEKLEKAVNSCDEDQASDNSISSLQKAYSSLKTILNRTKNIQKGFMDDKQIKEKLSHKHLLPTNRASA